MDRGRRQATVGTGVLLSVVVLASCSSSPTAGHRHGMRRYATTTTTGATTTSSPVTSSTASAVTLPNVIGFKIVPARTALRAVGLLSIGLNKPCTEGTVASQSVVDSLARPGRPPTPSVGAVPVSPGTKVPPGTRIAITWSGCYGNAVSVPDVVGLSFAAAKHAVKASGLTWACYSVGRPTTTTTTRRTTTSTSVPVTTTTRPPDVVLTQTPRAGGVLRPGATVTLTMHACPQ